MHKNKLYYGDCLTILNEMPSSSVDLIYLDPPFNSARDYNAIYKDETGRPLPDQIEAFSDTWTLDEATEGELRKMPVLMKENGIDNDVVEFWKLWMKALRKTNPAMLAYLSYMTTRLLPMKRLLKSTGSIYLHCDATASHYIKIMLDAIFGHKTFRREVVWSNEDRSGYKSQAKNWIRGSDSILFYTKTSSNKFTFNKQYEPLDEATIKRYDKADEEGRKYKIYKNKDGTERRAYLNIDRGVPLGSVWTDIPSFQTVNNTGEYMGYATQKPLALLERIITTSSNEGDIVLDPFCGCATTIEAAHKLKRQWIGIDIAIHAIKRVAKVRLKERLGLVDGRDFIIEGIPRNIEGARDLWIRDKYQFQEWAVEAVDGFVTARKSNDGGVDGRLYFTKASTDEDLSSMILEVKGGKTINPSILRDLRGTMEREGAEMAGLIIMDALGERQASNFGREDSRAGVLELNGVEYPRMQILTIEEILAGAKFMTPSRVVGRSEMSLPFYDEV